MDRYEMQDVTEQGWHSVKEMVKDPNGDYVKYSDVKSLEATNRNLLQALKSIYIHTEEHFYSDSLETIMTIVRKTIVKAENN